MSVLVSEIPSWAYLKFCVNGKGEKKVVFIYTIFLTGSNYGVSSTNSGYSRYSI